MTNHAIERAIQLEELQVDIMDREYAVQHVLTRRQRQVFNLHNVHDLTLTEAADLLGLRDHSMASKAYRAAERVIKAYLTIGTIRAVYDSARMNPLPEITPIALRRWIEGVGDGVISPMRVMDRATLSVLQKWLADNGDQKMRDWFRSKTDGWTHKEPDIPVKLYGDREYRNKYGRVRVWTADNQMCRWKSFKSRPFSDFGDSEAPAYENYLNKIC